VYTSLTRVNIFGFGLDHKDSDQDNSDSDYKDSDLTQEDSTLTQPKKTPPGLDSRGLDQDSTQKDSDLDLDSDSDSDQDNSDSDYKELDSTQEDGGQLHLDISTYRKRDKVWIKGLFGCGSCCMEQFSSEHSRANIYEQF